MSPSTDTTRPRSASRRARTARCRGPPRLTGAPSMSAPMVPRTLTLSMTRQSTARTPYLRRSSAACQRRTTGRGRRRPRPPRRGDPGPGPSGRPPGDGAACPAPHLAQDGVRTSWASPPMRGQGASTPVEKAPIPRSGGAVAHDGERPRRHSQYAHDQSGDAEPTGRGIAVGAVDLELLELSPEDFEAVVEAAGVLVPPLASTSLGTRKVRTRPWRPWRNSGVDGDVS